jgi:hypothetical protein
MAQDDDILDFDFQEDVTTELPPASRAAVDSGRPGDGAPRPRGRPRPQAPHGITPLLRLLGLVGVAIVVVVLLVVWGQGCSSDEKRARYNDYMTAVGTVGRDSARIGASLATLLTTPGLKQAALEKKLNGMIQKQQLDLQTAEGLDPPGPLTPANDHAVEALRLRVTGLQGLLQAFRATASTKDSTAAGRQLATQGRRLEASDVIWQDLFRAASEQITAGENVLGVTAPASVFVESEELYSVRQMTLLHQRIHAETTGGTTSGIHGSGLVRTRVLPAGTELSTSSETTVKASTDLGFEVTVKNTGENQEVQVQVTLTIPAQPNPIVKTGTIKIIDPGEEKTVVFKNFPEVPFGEKTTVQVNVKPVQGEQNTQNNSAEYPVVFSL